jgi:hypothetical protein
MSHPLHPPSWKDRPQSGSSIVVVSLSTALRYDQHFIETGRAPHYTELAGTLGVQPGEAREVQRQAAEASVACWLVQDTDYIESWAPFSNVPTHYWVSVDGQQKWYGQ